MIRATLLLIAVLLTFSTVLAETWEGADAVILEWERTFTLEDDGSVRRTEHRVVKLLSSRAYRRFADPRIDYEKGRETVRILRAVTHLSNGDILPVPEYSFNIAAPNDAAGWPRYAAWEQTIVSFSGLEPGAVIDLEYEVTTKPGVFPWLEADLRLRSRDPIEAMTVMVSVPEGSPLKILLAGAKPVEVFSNDEGRKTRAWRFQDLAPSPDEPQAPPWRERCGRLAFTTCPDVETFAGRILRDVWLSDAPFEPLPEIAKAAVAGESDPLEKVVKIVKLLKESYHALESRKTWRSLDGRDQYTVLRTNYGNPHETAVLCSVLLDACGLPSRPVLAMDTRADAFSNEVPLTSALAAVLVRVELPERVVLVHPTNGIVENDGASGPWLVLDRDGRGLVAEEIHPRGWNRRNEVLVTGKLGLDTKGKVAGSLKLKFTGLLFDPKKLEAEDGRKAFLGKAAAGVLSGLEVKSLTVQQLSSDAFLATAKVESKKPMLSFEGRHVIALGGGPLFLDRIPMPLGNPLRRTPVRIAGRFRERVDVALELPEGWTAAPPRRPIEVQGDWGLVRETVTATGKLVRIRREIEFAADTLSVTLFAGIRTALNDLRAPACRHLVVGRGEKVSAGR